MGSIKRFRLSGESERVLNSFSLFVALNTIRSQITRSVAFSKSSHFLCIAILSFTPSSFASPLSLGITDLQNIVYMFLLHFFSAVSNISFQSMRLFSEWDLSVWMSRYWVFALSQRNREGRFWCSRERFSIEKIYVRQNVYGEVKKLSTKVSYVLVSVKPNHFN